jgi:nitrile hydratase subunit beta
VPRINDLGGVQGFGPVLQEPNEPLFHAHWERRMLAIQRALAYTRSWHVDDFRDAQEKLPPHVYLAVSYYERWLLGLEYNCIQAGLVDPDELAASRALQPPKPVNRVLHLPDIGAVFSRGAYGRPITRPSLFAPGEAVRVRTMHPPSHTRLPRYAQGRTGTVEAIRGFHVYPDALVAGHGEDPQWLYTVVFEARELWGPEADPQAKVSFEAFEPYLEVV